MAVLAVSAAEGRYRRAESPTYTRSASPGPPEMRTERACPVLAPQVFLGNESETATLARVNVDVVVVIVVDVGGALELDPRRGWRATRFFVIAVDVVVDVGLSLVADSDNDNDIDYDYDGHSQVPPLSATLSDTPIDIDNDIDCDIDLTVRPV